ncbi:MAG TPA: tetratricopeptide repeat protein [Phycisphaerae bacterium]|nr:tetratricopeptide repeat protein [Phycisphaerae bacterium]
MANDKQSVNSASQQAGVAGAAPRFSEADKSKARKWFQRAQTVADSRNYDYAMECYINGLSIWPEAVEEGHMPLMGVGMARRSAGMKKAGVMEGLKHSVNARDPKQAMLNAEFLLAKDPGNTGHMEAVLRNANRGTFDQTIRWLGSTFLDFISRDKKPSASRLRAACEVFEQGGERTEQAQDFKAAIDLYQYSVTALEYLQQLKPGDLEITNKLRDVSSKLTIVKGNYEKGEDFRGSLQDGEQQKVLHDEDRMVQSADRLGELIERARQELANDASNPTKVVHLAELLCRGENEANENEAVELLTDAYAKLKNYRFKMRADDIRMRQYRRKARQLIEQTREDPENGLLRQRASELAEQMKRFEMEVFTERVDSYPTDLRIRFEYGVRLFQAGRYDEAIPALQDAQSDPRHRERCQLYIGRCFVARKYYDQAIKVLTDALAKHESQDDDVSKQLHYWLGRSYEEDGKTDDALRTYGQIIQWDYNYQDVRQRIDVLRGSGSEEK